MLPLLETFNPRAVEALARAAGLLRADAEALGREACRLLVEATDLGARPRGVKRDEPAGKNIGRAATEDAPPLRVEALAEAMPAVRRRALRLWLGRGRGDLRRVELAHVCAVEKLLEGARGGRVAELPGGGRVERRGRWIFFRGAARAGKKEVEGGAPET
ncbi:MAG: TilS substrate-binding domain-containing protein [Acidobacteria bacterium]|nr:TilS substrate-binding domain-containing protein [Acidobacteriota bacterium]